LDDPYSLQRSEGELNHELVEVQQSLASVGSGEKWIYIVDLQTRDLSKIITPGHGSRRDNA
jgi:hypothetical protein